MRKLLLLSLCLLLSEHFLFSMGSFVAEEMSGIILPSSEFLLMRIVDSDRVVSKDILTLNDDEEWQIEHAIGTNQIDYLAGGDAFEDAFAANGSTSFHRSMLRILNDGQITELLNGEACIKFKIRSLTANFSVCSKVLIKFSREIDSWIIIPVAD